MNKFAYFGTPTVASETLEALLAHGYKPEVVITNPDAPKGRGLVLAPTPTKEVALAHSIPVLTPESLDAAAIEEIKKCGCEYAIVIAYGKIFPQALIDAFPKGAINVHYSLLPKYRGAAPVEGALRSGDSVTGVTVQQMAFAMDAGDILAQEEVAIAESETVRELFPRLIEAGATLLLKTLPAFEAGSIARVAQDASQATYAKKIKKEEGLLDLAGDARENWNKYRAYYFRPGTYFMRGHLRVKIKQAIYKDGTFVIERVVPEGKPEMDYASFIQAQA